MAMPPCVPQYIQAPAAAAAPAAAPAPAPGELPGRCLAARLLRAHSRQHTASSQGAAAAQEHGAHAHISRQHVLLTPVLLPCIHRRALTLCRPRILHIPAISPHLATAACSSAHTTHMLSSSLCPAAAAAPAPAPAAAAPAPAAPAAKLDGIEVCSPMSGSWYRCAAQVLACSSAELRPVGLLWAPGQAAELPCESGAALQQRHGCAQCSSA
jgi:hypothetical protein